MYIYVCVFVLVDLYINNNNNNNNNLVEFVSLNFILVCVDT